MSEVPFTILVVCTGNSARSIIGEALFNRLGAVRVRAFSAGSRPAGTPNPAAVRLLLRKGIDPAPFRSKSWLEFAAPDAPAIDLALTVCGNAAGEACPVFRGAPLCAHWGLPDPAAVTGDQAAIDAAFEQTWERLSRRIQAFLALPFETLEPADLTARLGEIGAMEGAA